MTDDKLPPEFWQGVEQFNQRQFYDCHDTLEALWMEAIDPERTFYQGLLQIAVALYHLGNQNLRGAIILLGEGMNRLRHYQPSFADIAVTPLLDQSRALQAKLQQAQAEQQTVILHQEQPGATAAENAILLDLPQIKRTPMAQA
jgi:uncharacterized protein